MGEEILTNNQKRLLDILCKDKSFVKNFYFTGGTALSAYYLNHRYSEDMDFFCEKEVDPIWIDTLLKKNKSALSIKKMDFQKSFNRNIYFLHLENEDILKAEFTYFPFTRIEKGKTKNGLAIDSLTDIAVNKIFTISEYPRARDFIDMYLILQKKPDLTLNELFKKARSKFDWHIDPLALGAQFSMAKEVKDFPKMIIDLPASRWQNFFIEKAKKFAKDIFK